MSTNNKTQNTPIDENKGDDAQPKTPLELVKEQQAMQQQNLEAAEQTPNPTPEVVGNSKPSTKRHFPQRQHYEGGENDPNYTRLK
jgi:hypothetical protein